MKTKFSLVSDCSFLFHFSIFDFGQTKAKSENCVPNVCFLNLSDQKRKTKVFDRGLNGADDVLRTMKPTMDVIQASKKIN